MCPPDDIINNTNIISYMINGHPICAQFIERSLDGGKQGGGVEVVEENLQSDLQLIPDQGRHHEHGDHS